MGDALTLPASLAYQALTRGDAVALRRKVLGRWRVWTWRQLRDEVVRIAAALAAGGVGRGDRVVVGREARPEALLAALAVQWLGGVAAPADAGAAAGSGGTLSPLVTRTGESTTGAVQILAGPDDDAFVYEIERGGAPWCIRHSDALASARALIRRTSLRPDHDALVPLSLTPDIACAFVGAWLVAGFRLNLPEGDATQEVDRREVAPMVVVGTARTYAQLRQRVLEGLPPPKTPSRRLADWALRPDPPNAGILERAAGNLLVRRPLREVLGLSRVELSLVADAFPEEAVVAFFARLGLHLRALVQADEELAVSPSAGTVERPAGLLPAIPEEAS
jgi:long-subunit acyl-CoA synthetase (AMP-forming)